VIEVINHPPQQPGDVRLTEGARKFMISQSRKLRSGQRVDRHDFWLIGMSMGYSVGSALESASSEQAGEITEPVFVELEQIMLKPGVFAVSAMRHGFSQASHIESQLSAEREGALL